MKLGVRCFDHVIEYAPVASLYLHRTFYGHAHHCLKSMYDVQVLSIVDSGASLNDVGSKSTFDLTSNQYFNNHCSCYYEH